MTILFAGITNVYVNVQGGCMWSSARMGYVVSWYGRVVVVVVRSRTFDEGSWRRSSRGDTAGCFMLVSWDRSSRWIQLDFWHFVGMVESWLLARNSESLRGLVVAMLGQSVTASRYVDWMLHCRSVVVGRSISRFWLYVGLTGGVSIWWLARNSESLRGLDAAMLV